MFWTKSIFKKKRDLVDHAGEIDPKYVEEAKLAFRERKCIIDEWVDNYYKEYKSVHQPILDEINAEIDHKNSVCSKCGSTEVVNKFIKDRLKTFEYNHCNGCGNEWKKESRHCPFVDQDAEACRVAHMLDMIVLQLFNIVYNPYDVSEEYDSQEEKEQGLANAFMEHNTWKKLLEMPLEIIYYFAYKHANHQCCETEEVFGKDIHYDFNNNYEQYAGRFTPKMEDILINKLNVKKMF